MRVLVVVVGTSPASAFAVAPLASSLRAAGHDVLVASFAELVDTVAALGLPAVAIPTEQTTTSIMTMDRPGGVIEFPFTPDKELPFLGHWFGRQAAVTLDGLGEIADAWRPDLLLGGTMAYAVTLLGARLGIPAVRQAWDWVDFVEAHAYADVELAAEVAEAGLHSVATPDLFLDICPPSLRRADRGGRPMRWAPGNRQRPLEPWMYTTPDRPRVCVTFGSFRTGDPAVRARLAAVVEELSALDAEVVVAAGEPAAAELTARFPQVRAGWVPLEVLAPTCDVIAHPNGGLTAMNAMAAGTPQVIFSRFTAFDESLRRLEQQGSAVTLYRDEDTPDRIATGIAKVLADPSFADRASLLAAEVATMPAPPDLVEDLVALAAGR